MNNRHATHKKSKDAQLRQHFLDRYKQHLQFAELRISTGDRIGAENDFQHAEHFFRAAAEEKDAGR